MKELLNEKLKLNISLHYLLELLMILGLYWICDEAGIKKYGIVLLLSIVFTWLSRKKKCSIEAFICTALPMIIYLFMGSVGALLSAHFYDSTIKIILFCTLPYLLVFSFYAYYGKDMERIVDYQMIASCMVFFKPNPLEIIAALHFETVYAFTFGLFVLYYSYKKRWGMFTLAMIFMYMSDKRIAFLAVGAALIVMGILWLFRNNRKLAAFIWSIVSIAVNFYVYFIYSGKLEYYCQGMGINTNGRVKMFGLFAEWFDRSFLWFGKGIGVVEKLLENWQFSDFANLHNDLLKFYIELGLLGLLLLLLGFGICFFRAGNKIGKPQMTFLLVIAVYSMVLFATDNVSIYVLYLIPMYSMCFAVLASTEKS